MSGPSQESSNTYRYFNNWISLAGAVVALGSAFAFILLFAIDTLSGGENAYLGILSYVVAPAFLILGIGMGLTGWYLHRRQILYNRGHTSALTLSLDLNRSEDRRKFLLFTSLTLCFLLLSALGSYKTYHFTESVTFCGTVCHTVMEPEYTAYKLGAHARVDCVECHIGSGAQWYVKSKLSGLYQVYSVIFNKYSRPIGTPVQNLRPAQDTCEQCHWPEKFSGDLDRTFTRYSADEDNTPYTIRLALKVGGAQSAQGPARGIHWHISNTVEFIASDARQEVIPWVRVTDDQGLVTEYRTPSFKDPIANQTIERMDCVDCHNRPSHVYHSPNDAVDQALSSNRLDPSLKGLKELSVRLLTGEYASNEQARQAIEKGLAETYPEDSRNPETGAALFTIYRENFFPVMKVSWKHYPNHIGHKDTPGCFRCHDDEHATTDGTKRINMSNCNSCHSILAQGGTPEELTTLHPAGVEFLHPGGATGGGLCSDCHTGASF